MHDDSVFWRQFYNFLPQKRREFVLTDILIKLYSIADNTFLLLLVMTISFKVMHRRIVIYLSHIWLISVILKYAVFIHHIKKHAPLVNIVLLTNLPKLDDHFKSSFDKLLSSTLWISNKVINNIWNILVKL